MTDPDADSNIQNMTTMMNTQIQSSDIVTGSHNYNLTGEAYTSHVRKTCIMMIIYKETMCLSDYLRKSLYRVGRTTEKI